MAGPGPSSAAGPRSDRKTRPRDDPVDPAAPSSRPSKALLMRYRTEIFVPNDRYVCLQLPDYLPEGKAVVIIQFEDPDKPDPAPGAVDDSGRHDDIEWWEEVDEAGGTSR